MFFVISTVSLAGQHSTPVTAYPKIFNDFFVFVLVWATTRGEGDHKGRPSMSVTKGYVEKHGNMTELRGCWV